MSGRRSRWRTWGIVLISYLLVVQTTLTGMVLGAQAAPQPSAFAVLCAPSGASKAPEAPADDHALPNCCVMGCSMLGGGTGPTPDAAFTAPPPVAEPAFVVAASFAAISRSPDPSPRTTRAPPRSA